MNKISNNEFRCFGCGKLLAKHDLRQNALEIKCLRCGLINSVFKNIGQQVLITDPDGIILYANSLVEKTTGYTLAEIIGQRPSLWGKQMRPAFYRRMWQQIKKDKKPLVVKITNRRKNGAIYRAILQISPVFNTTGQIKLFVAMETEIIKTT